MLDSPSVFSLEKGCNSSTNDRLFFWQTASAADEQTTAICGEKVLPINSRGVSLHWAMISVGRSRGSSKNIYVYARAPSTSALHGRDNFFSTSARDYTQPVFAFRGDRARVIASRYLASRPSAPVQRRQRQRRILVRTRR